MNTSTTSLWRECINFSQNTKCESQSFNKLWQWNRECSEISWEYPYGDRNIIFAGGALCVFSIGLLIAPYIIFKTNELYGKCIKNNQSQITISESTNKYRANMKKFTQAALVGNAIGFSLITTIFLRAQITPAIPIGANCFSLCEKMRKSLLGI